MPVSTPGGARRYALHGRLGIVGPPLARKSASFVIPALLIVLVSAATLFVGMAPVVRCGLCGGVGQRFAVEVHGTSIHLACPRCCPHDFIEPGRKVAMIRNWIPGLTPNRTRADVEMILNQPRFGPNGLRRFQGYR